MWFLLNMFLAWMTSCGSGSGPQSMNLFMGSVPSWNWKYSLAVAALPVGAFFLIIFTIGNARKRFSLLKRPIFCFTPLCFVFFMLIVLTLLGLSGVALVLPSSLGNGGWTSWHSVCAGLIGTMSFVFFLIIISIGNVGGHLCGSGNNNGNSNMWWSSNRNGRHRGSSWSSRGFNFGLLFILHAVNWILMNILAFIGGTINVSISYFSFGSGLYLLYVLILIIILGQRNQSKCNQSWNGGFNNNGNGNGGGGDSNFY